MKTTPKTGKVVAAFPVDDDSEIIIITQQAKLIRIEIDKIRKTGRSAQGVMLIRTGTDDLVTSASLLTPESEEVVAEVAGTPAAKLRSILRTRWKLTISARSVRSTNSR